MDIINEIDAEIVKLRSLRDKLTQEIEDLQKESDTVKDDAFNLTNKVKDLMSSVMRYSEGFKGTLGKAIHYSVNNKFDNAQDYLNYISQSISRIHDYISQVDQATANLEKSKSDLGYMMQSVQTWINRSKELQ
jgi:predicted  nucleic acid-binding Zn-ribbon protein